MPYNFFYKLRWVLVFIVLPISLNCLAQITRNNIEIKVRNDDAGEVSNWLNTGDDVGETQSFMLEANLVTLHPEYNFRLKVESTEYSNFEAHTLEPRDIRFSEVNNFQLTIDNKKLKNKAYFFSVSPGLYFIQFNHLTPGASGQKYYWHKWVVNKFYPDKNWIYLNSYMEPRYIPYGDFKYGRCDSLVTKTHFSLSTRNNFDLQVATDINYSGIGASTFFDLCWLNQKYRLNAIHLELEANYSSNIIQSQTASCQAQIKLCSRHFACYTGINKPLAKNLHNPHIYYDDMELLFNYGIIVLF